MLGFSELRWQAMRKNSRNSLERSGVKSRYIHSECQNFGRRNPAKSWELVYWCLVGVDLLRKLGFTGKFRWCYSGMRKRKDSFEMSAGWYRTIVELLRKSEGEWLCMLIKLQHRWTSDRWGPSGRRVIQIEYNYGAWHYRDHYCWNVPRQNHGQTKVADPEKIAESYAEPMPGEASMAADPVCSIE